jgi:hypothetical protein
MKKQPLQNPGLLPAGGNTRAGDWIFRNLLIITCLLLWLLPIPIAEADSFRCGRKVVRSGDAQSTVLSACGQPQHKDTAQEAIWTGASQKTVRVQRWYYKSSSRKLERVVLIYQGKVIAVQTGGR